MKFCPFELESSWRKELEEELSQPYIAELAAFVELERERQQLPIYPPKELVFNALNSTPYNKVRVVIVGQDPYHGKGQAHGLCFSVPLGVVPPPSLKNIFKELETDLGLQQPSHGCLIPWATQGVLLLNATLTVRDAQAKSHYGKGWERFTDAVIAAIGRKKEPVVFLLWGKSAADKVRSVKEIQGNHQHLILTCAHPSPLSAYNGFFGCKHFSQTNCFLAEQGLPSIDWALDFG